MSENQIKVFENVDFGKVRIIEMNGEPWFVGKDAAEILGYSNTRDALSKHVDDEDKADVAIHDGRQNRNMTVINESGLYSLILSSKLQKAKEFKHWVTADVIPQIRKTGRYTAPNVPNMDKLSLTTQCLINIEIANNQLRKDLDGAIKRIEELESRNETTEEQPEPQAKTEPKPWSERELDYLRKAYALGQTDVEIAADLGRTISSISNKRRVLGLHGQTCQHWTPAEDKKLIKLRKQGVTYLDIGKLIGKSYDSIHNRLYRLRKAGRL